MSKIFASKLYLINKFLLLVGLIFFWGVENQALSQQASCTNPSLLTITSREFIEDFALSADGQWLALADSRNIQLWSVPQKHLFKSLEEDSGIAALAFSPNRNDLLIGRDDGKIVIQNMDTKKRTVMLTDPKQPISAIAVSPDGLLLASTSIRERSLKLWDLKTQKLIRTLDTRLEFPSDLLFSPDGKTLWVSIAQSTVDASPADTVYKRGVPRLFLKAWDIKNLKQTEPITKQSLHGDQFFDLAISPDGRILAATTVKCLGRNCASEVLRVKLWNLTTGKTVNDLIIPDVPFINEHYISLAPDNKILAIGHTKGIQLWDITTGKRTRALSCSSAIGKVIFHPSQKFLAVVVRGRDNLIVLLDLKAIPKPPP